MYFTNRQDRYALISAAPQLAEFFANLAGAIGDISYGWRDGQLTPPPAAPDPVAAPKAFKKAARSVVQGGQSRRFVGYGGGGDL